MRDFGYQLRAPLAMPVINLAMAFAAPIVVVSEALLCALTLFVDKKRAGTHLLHALAGVLQGIYCASSAVFDPLFELVSLATRSGASVASGIGAFITSFAKSGDEGTFNLESDNNYNDNSNDNDDDNNDDDNNHDDNSIIAPLPLPLPLPSS